MKYILINPLGILNAFQRAELLSRELYCLTLPRIYQEENQHECNVFPVLKIGNVVALGVFMDYEIPIHPEADLEGYISLYSGQYEDQVREVLNNSNLVKFEDIYPDPIFLTEEEINNLINN